MSTIWIVFISVVYVNHFS